VDTTTATASAVAIGASIVAKDGVKVTGRSGWGGYTRITGSTVQWTEVGDTLPGQPIYDTAVPFFVSPTSLTDITIVGGRTFDVTMEITAVPSLTGGTIVAQVRADAPYGMLLATMHAETVDATHVRFWLSPYETQYATGHGFYKGVWDAEIRLNGAEVTIVPQSKVTLVQGVTQLDGFYPDPVPALGVAFDARVEVVV
jgi:hypothetical protein